MLVTEEKAKGGRRKCDFPSASKQSYALALQEQIAEQKLKQATQKTVGCVCCLGCALIAIASKRIKHLLGPITDVVVLGYQPTSYIFDQIVTFVVINPPDTYRLLPR